MCTLRASCRLHHSYAPLHQNQDVEVRHTLPERRRTESAGKMGREQVQEREGTRGPGADEHGYPQAGGACRVYFVMATSRYWQPCFSLQTRRLRGATLSASANKQKTTHCAHKDSHSAFGICLDMYQNYPLTSGRITQRLKSEGWEEDLEALDDVKWWYFARETHVDHAHALTDDGSPAAPRFRREQLLTRAPIRMAGHLPGPHWLYGRSSG